MEIDPAVAQAFGMFVLVGAILLIVIAFAVLIAQWILRIFE